MRIRSITYFLNPGSPPYENAFKAAKEFIDVARPEYSRAGIEVQTARLATVPFSRFIPELVGSGMLDYFLRFEHVAINAGFDYISLGPAIPSEPRSYALIPEVLAATQNLFLSGLLTSGIGDISMLAVKACADVIHRASDITPDGFANLRFAALANVPPGAPFFPAAYHKGEKPAFALAIEAADLAVTAFSQAITLEDAQHALIAEIERQTTVLQGISNSLVDMLGLPFAGIDFTLAPFPEAMRSIGTAIERLGVPAVGMHGSLAACALLTSSLDQARFKRTGFNGLMLPVLEDAVLAGRAGEGLLSLNDLLLYSAVCGTGLDTVPLPGDTSAAELAGVLLDMAALAVRLDKPLTARLMPIPGKAAGEVTSFDFDYFANSRVLPLKARAINGLLSKAENVHLARLHAQRGNSG
jgi:uncharacterized protein (UPF0210 family)